MIEAIIFDMDGLLIDSEPYWEAAEMSVFRAVGVPLTPVLKKRTTGLRTDDIVSYWFSRYPWLHPSPADVAAQIVLRVVDQVMASATLKHGARQALDACAHAGFPLALASSSPPAIIDAVMDRLALRAYFKIIHSADREPYGKPHPAVYLSTAQQLGMPAEHCLAVEDSPNGVLAAKAAKMACIAVPDPHLKNHGVFHIADQVLGSLAYFVPPARAGADDQ